MKHLSILALLFLLGCGGGAQAPSAPAFTPSPDMAYVIAITSQSYKNTPGLKYCGDATLEMQKILDASDIPSRQIDIATAEHLAGNDLYGTHVLPEVYINDTGRWCAFEPTFEGWYYYPPENRCASILDVLNARYSVVLVLLNGNTRYPDWQSEGHDIFDYFDAVCRADWVGAYTEGKVDTRTHVGGLEWKGVCE